MKADVRGVPYESVEKPKGKEEKDPLSGRYSQGMDGLQRVMVGLEVYALHVCSLIAILV